MLCAGELCAEDPRPGIESWEGSGEILRVFFFELLTDDHCFIPPKYLTMVVGTYVETTFNRISLSFYPLPGYKDMRQAYQKRTQSQGNGGRRGVPQDAHQQRRQDQRRPFLGLRHGGRRCGSTHIGVGGQV